MLPAQDTAPIYRLHEPAFRTQYAELKERCASSGPLLPGTPGRLVLRNGTGNSYWYRSYYAVPGQPAEDFVCKDGDDALLQTEHQRIEFATWAQQQLRHLRALQFQVADKAVARVLVELRNAGLFASGLVVVGSLGYMAWLNELGARAVASRTHDIDLARRQGLNLAAPASFLRTVEATKLRFCSVPGLNLHTPSTALKRPGAEGLRIDVLTDGDDLGQIKPVPELDWHAQTIPFYDYLLRSPRPAAILAGGHCVGVNLAAPERFVWHKLYASAARAGFAEKAQKDLVQAATLAAVLVEQDDADLAGSWAEVPAGMVAQVKTRLPALRKLLKNHPQTLTQFEDALHG